MSDKHLSENEKREQLGQRMMKNLIEIARLEHRAIKKMVLGDNGVFHELCESSRSV